VWATIPVRLDGEKDFVKLKECTKIKTAESWGDRSRTHRKKWVIWIGGKKWKLRKKNPAKRGVKRQKKLKGRSITVKGWSFILKYEEAGVMGK